MVDRMSSVNVMAQRQNKFVKKSNYLTKMFRAGNFRYTQSTSTGRGQFCQTWTVLDRVDNGGQQKAVM